MRTPNRLLAATTGVLIGLTVLFVAFVWAGGTRGWAAQSYGPRPDPTLAPAEVVRIQLDALQSNGTDNAGIATTFAFASPANRAVTGPLPRFVALVNNEQYRPLLNSVHYRRSEVVLEEGQARQIVIVKDDQGREAAFMFTLERQTQAPYAGCWMTAGVMRLAEKYDTYSL